MPMSRVFLKRLKNLGVDQSGAIAAYAAIGLTVFLGFGALTVDIGHMVSVKGELQKAADAGALAGARGLWPVNLSTATSREPNGSNAETIALTTAKNNRVDGANLTSAEVTAEAGRWNYVTKQFTPGNNSSANGVRVTTTRPNVQMFLAQVLGQVPRDMSASAVAIMDFAAGVGKGSLPIAVSLAKAIVPGEVYIRKSTDVTDNGGWFSDELDVASAQTFKKYIEDDSCPAQNVGDIINLNNGEATSALEALKKEFEANYPLPEGWLVILPVVDTPKFNQTDTIESFVAYRILEVTSTGSDKYLRGMVERLGLTTSAQPGIGNGGVPTGGLSPVKLVQ